MTRISNYSLVSNGLYLKKEISLLFDFHLKKKQNSYQYENMFNMLHSNNWTLHRSTMGRVWSSFNIKHSAFVSELLLSLLQSLDIAWYQYLSTCCPSPFIRHCLTVANGSSWMFRTLPYISHRNSVKGNSKILKALLCTWTLFIWLFSEM